MNAPSATLAARSRCPCASSPTLAIPPSTPIACCKFKALMPCCSTCACPARAASKLLVRSKPTVPEALVIVVTGYGTVQSAVQAMKHGAYEYVTKPFSVEELKLLLQRVSNHLKLKTENRMLREKLKSKQGYGGIAGRAPEMEKLYRIIAKAANSSHPVLILGESGTGKEMVARSIHYSGPFHDKPFIPVDCGSLVPTLIESELFGYVKGAFTGANQAKDGLLAIAE